MKLPEKIKGKNREYYQERYDQGKISEWQLSFSLNRLKLKAEVAEKRRLQKEKDKIEYAEFRKRRKISTISQNEELKFWEKAYKIFCPKHKREEISRYLSYLVYDKNIKKNGKLVCYLCHKDIIVGEESIDHIFPVRKGGKNELDNLDMAHLSCNISKHSKTIEEYEAIRSKRKK